MIRHLCIQSFSFSKIGVRASLAQMRRNPATRISRRSCRRGFLVQCMVQKRPGRFRNRDASGARRDSVASHSEPDR